MYAFLYRSLARYFFSELYVNFVLRSKRVKNYDIKYHLKMRRFMLMNLKNPNDFVGYQGLK